MGGDDTAEAAEEVAPVTAPPPQKSDGVSKVLVDAHAGPSRPKTSQRLIAEANDVGGDDDDDEVDDDDGRFADADEDEGGHIDTPIHLTDQDHVQLLEIQAAWLSDETALGRVSKAMCLALSFKSVSALLIQ